MASKDIGNCWACEPKKSKAREQHHVLPVEYGGPEDGKTVALCPSCHTEAHDLARAAIKGEEIDYEPRKRIQTLANYIVVQYNKLQDSGKTKADTARNMIQISLPKEELAIAHDLKRMLGMRSLERTLRLLIREKWLELKRKGK